ncbi:hypothetical protein [Rhodococcus sp. ANT_H53B]|uniref:hypothetical protein n=1 Tax=Rhodococcus sp. ANT_H53B TaxID=2597357 RepID=UPI0011ED86A0|nr:hypothetical protein [Rhodococcus sp. ANT_H53B]KAA0925956.1 hypothetical protein FQ188_10400 [Rhodococcus sp. ANT_H53B]
MAIQRLILDIEMEDGTEHLGIKTNLADQAKFAKSRSVHKWPSVQEDPITFINFLAFAALSRLGKFEGGFDKFCNEAGAVQEAGQEEITPTK